MADHDDLDPTLLARYWGGTASPADVECLRQWAGDDLARRNQLAALGRAWAQVGEVSTAVGPTPDVSSAWAGLAARTASAARTARSAPARVPHTWPPGVGGSAMRPVGAGRAPRFWMSGSRAVAALVLAAVATASYVAVHGRRTRRATPGQEYRTMAGERAHVTLADGTQLTLAPDSRVQVAADYPRHRALSLDGEAYIEAVHDPARPLTVRTGTAVVVDIGTRFDVRAYASDTTVRVVVADGAVGLSSGLAVRSTKAGTIVTAGDMATLSAMGAVRVVSRVPVAYYLGWTEGRLVFTDARLVDVLPELSRWYGLDLHVDDAALGRGRLTTTIHGGSVDEMLDAIALVAHAQYVRNGRRVTFFPANTRGAR